MKARSASAPRPVYRAKAQPADEGGHAVLRGGVVIFNDLHASLASAIAHDLNAAVGSGRVYRCGPLSAGQECKILASDGTKVKTPRVYVGDATEFVAELNRAAMPRPNPAKRERRWFDLPPMPRFPRLTREDYRRLRAHAMEWVNASDAPGDPMRLSVGMVYAAPDLVGGTHVDFRSDPLRRGFSYPLSADLLARRAGVHDARENPSWRKRSPAEVGAPRVYWRWVNAGGYSEGEFFLPASIRTEAQMRANRDLVLRRIAVASDMSSPRPAAFRRSQRSAGRHASIPRHSFGRVEILPRVRSVGYGVDEVIEWDVVEDGEKIGSFRFVRTGRRPTLPKRRAAAK